MNQAKRVTKAFAKLLQAEVDDRPEESMSRFLDFHGVEGTIKGSQTDNDGNLILVVETPKGEFQLSLRPIQWERTPTS